MSAMSEKIREEFKAADDIRDEGLTAPEGIDCFRDIVYADGMTGEDAGKWHSLDVYRPQKDGNGTPLGTQGAGGPEKLPVIVSVHGGGWVYGDKERYSFYCMDLAKRGFVVVNFNYRLAPEYKYPAPVEDINLVMEWCFENADAYGLDMDRLFAVGDSAGAHLLAIYACICTNAEYAANYGFEVPEGIVFRAVALNCGQYEVRLDATADKMMKELAVDLLPEGGTAEEQKLVSPNRHITGDFPPTFFMTAPKDYLLPQAQILQMALVIAGVDFTYRFYCDPKSSLGHVFHLDMRSEWAKKCNDEECDYFRGILTQSGKSPASKR